jgi:hypothetical protein
MNVLIIQPPLVQLNTAYPSGAYLSSFFRSCGCSVHWSDLSIELFYRIFSKQGLQTLFSQCSSKAIQLAAEAEKNGDPVTAFNLRRYVSEQDQWCSWISTITALLQSGASGTGAYESAHRFVFGAHAPRGNRMERFLAEIDHQLTTDDARSLASFALADLADFIMAVFDPHFSLVRYAESLTVSESCFSEIEKAVDASILTTFYEPLLQDLFNTTKLSELFYGAGENQAERLLVCISVPFAGTFAAALCTGRFFKQLFGNRVFVVFGGGFINTELRDTTETSLEKYGDALCYDRGYGSYRELLDSGLLQGKQLQGTLYKVRLFTDGRCIAPTAGTDVRTTTIRYEAEQTVQVVPDYHDIDFSRYPRLLDDTNPMHRLWSDGAWLKAFLAHGCYWHQCAFCDVTLDYVCGYHMTDIRKLYKTLLRQAEEKKVYGIHFVDEAAPPVALMLFARENIAHGCPLTFWGNIRFEKTFTRDIADYLAYGGLIGVSGGIEIASGSGLDKIHKGTSLDSIVSACCAFKEAGILVHAYMIYGYWQETALDTINSMETLRQFYGAGLLDSSFWHKFVLTRHSRIYTEWKNGNHQELKPIEPARAGIFAHNGLHFSGEEKTEKFSIGLNSALDSWMHGRNLDRAVTKWFEFPLPLPTVSKKYVAEAIARYEQNRDAEFHKPLPDNQNRVVWIGGKKIPTGNHRDSWMYLGEMETEKRDSSRTALRGRGLCVLPDWSALFASPVTD